MLLPDVLAQHGHCGTGDDEVQHTADSLRAELSGEGFETQTKNPGQRGDHSELDDRQQNHVTALGAFGYGYHVDGKKDAARQRQGISCGNSQIPAQRNEADPRNAQECGDKMVGVRPCAVRDSCKKWDQDTVYRR